MSTETMDILVQVQIQREADLQRLDDEHAKIIAALAECRARELELIARRDEIDKARRKMTPRAPRGTKKAAAQAAAAEGGGEDE